MQKKSLISTFIVSSFGLIIFFNTHTYADSDNGSPCLGLEGQASQQCIEEFLNHVPELIVYETEAEEIFIKAKELLYDSEEPADMDRVIKMYLESAEKGFTDAQIEVALLYASGEHLKLDLNQSHYWLEQALKSGKPLVCYYLGVLYLNPKFEKSNINTGIDYLKQAGYNKNKLATFMLGELYENGKHIPQSLPQAFYWYNYSMYQGSNEATIKVAQFYANGKGIEQNKEIAFELLDGLFRYRYPEYFIELGKAYRDGTDGFPKDFEIAKQWFQDALEMNIEGAEEALKSLTRE